MAEPGSTHSIDMLIQEVLCEKEMEVEHRINVFRSWIGALFIPAILIETAVTGKLGMVMPYFAPFMLIFAGYSFAIHRVTASGAYRPLVKYFTISADFVFVMFMFYVFILLGIHLFSPEGEAWAIIMVFMLLIVLSALRYSIPAIVFSCGLGVLGTLWLAWAVAGSEIVAVHGSLVIAFSTALVVLYSRDFRHTFIRLHQRESLTRFLPREMVESIDRGDISLALGGEEKQVTLLLTDIRDFTALSEKMNPTELVALLNEYLGCMTEVIFQYGGTLDKFIGDAILSVFGSPVAHGDDPERAIRTALHMGSALDSLNGKLAGQGIPPLKIGMALHTGLVVAGNIGSPLRMDFTVIGDSVNLVSRIEGLNKEYGTRILMSESTFQQVRGIVEAELIAETAVRGRKQEIRIYGLKE